MRSDPLVLAVAEAARRYILSRRAQDAVDADAIDSDRYIDMAMAASRKRAECYSVLERAVATWECHGDAGGSGPL